MSLPHTLLRAPKRSEHIVFSPVWRPLVSLPLLLQGACARAMRLCEDDKRATYESGGRGGLRFGAFEWCIGKDGRKAVGIDGSVRGMVGSKG